MNPLEALTLAWQALRHTVPSLFRPKLWMWALPLAALQIALIAALWHAAHPLVSWFMAPLLVAVSGADTLHYPRIFELMSGMYGRADVLIGALLGSVAIGAAMPVFAAHFRGEPTRPRAALAQAFRRAPHFIAVLLPFNVLLLLMDFVVRTFLAPRLGAGLVGRVLPIVVAGASLALQAAFFYAAALVALEGRSAISALKALPSTWRPGYLAALFVSVATLLLMIPVHLPGITPSMLVNQGIPELAGWLTVLQMVASLLNSFLLTGAATLLYLSAVRPSLRES